MSNETLPRNSSSVCNQLCNARMSSSACCPSTQIRTFKTYPPNYSSSNPSYERRFCTGEWYAYCDTACTPVADLDHVCWLIGILRVRVWCEVGFACDSSPRMPGGREHAGVPELNLCQP